MEETELIVEECSNPSTPSTGRGFDLPEDEEFLDAEPFAADNVA